MKKFIKLLILSPMAFSLISCNGGDSSSSSTSTSSSTTRPKSTDVFPTGPVDVVVISGQSNAAGCTKASCIQRSIGYSKYQEYMAGYPSIKIAYDCWTKDEGPMFYSHNTPKDNNFVKVMLGQGNSLATFGPEIGIAERMHETYGDKLFIIKYACGASNLKDDWTKRDSPMYGRFIEYVKLQMDHLREKGCEPTIRAFCWMQGEGDAWDGYYQDYKANLTEFVGNVREDLKELSGNKDVPFIDAGISNSPQWQYYRQVNNAKKEFAAESDNNFFIDTIEAGLHTDQEPFDTPDTAHYDTESQVQLGNLFAEAFEQFLSK